MKHFKEQKYNYNISLLILHLLQKIYSIHGSSTLFHRVWTVS